MNSRNSFVQGYLLQLMRKVVGFIDMSNRNWPNISRPISQLFFSDMFVRGTCSLGFSSKYYLLVYISKPDNHLFLPLFLSTMFVKNVLNVFNRNVVTDNSSATEYEIPNNFKVYSGIFYLCMISIDSKSPASNTAKSMGVNC